MVDRLSQAERSRLMAKVKPKNTQPEIVVRRVAHRMGFRFRLHKKDLPGSPDLVFPSLRKVIFVHGCFWHRHRNCRLATTPKSNNEFWEAKFEANTSRDRRNQRQLIKAGWDVLTIWQCESKDEARLVEILSRFLGSRS